MKAWHVILVICFLACFQGYAIDPDNVVILVNQDDDDSIDLGYYYALKREVPIENIVHISLPEDERITWETYLTELYNPLMTWLLEAGWLEGFDSSREDTIGRKVRLIDSHRIEALVLCKGVPLRIDNDPNRLPPRDTYPKNRTKFYTNRSSVDSELALLPFPGANVDAYFPNPMFRRTKPKNLFDMKPIVVGRLDGPSYELARGLVDNALKAESEGIAGRAYVDIGGPHEQGDTWLEELSDQFVEQGFDLDIHSEKNRFNLVDRFDEPLFYFGWYAGGIDGPFTHYDFKFPVGAIALHIHSYTAASVRSGRKHWVGPLVARGVTATFGNTNEPYLYLTHQPHHFLTGLMKGMTTGEAALYAIPGLSWAGVFIGDPLYLPPLGLKMSPKNEYDVLRTANTATQAGDPSAYKAVLFEHEETHHFATGLWLHQFYLQVGDKDNAYVHLHSIIRPNPEDPKKWGVLIEMSEAYLQLGYPKEALPILDDLLSRTQSKREVRSQLLQRFLKLAKEYELPEKAAAWQEQLNKLTAPAKDKK